MDNKNKKVSIIAKIGLVTAAYAVSTIALGSLSYGPFGFRLSEMLNFLAFIDPYYIPALTLGCAIANFYSFSLVDVFVGGFSTFITTYAMWKTKNMAVATIWPILGCFIITTELYFVLKLPFFYTLFVQVVGETVVMVAGYFVFKELFKNKKFIEKIRICDTKKKLI